MTNIKIQKNNYKFIAIKTMIAMLVIAMFAVVGLADYNKILDSSNKEATNIKTTVESVKKLNALVNSYLEKNNGKISPGHNISISGIMQQENLIPNSWTITGDNLIPLNRNFISSYKILTDSDFIKPAYMIIIKAPKMTNEEALAICNSLTNIISGVSSNDNPTFNISRNKTCLKALFNNQVLLANNLPFKKNLTFTFILK